MSQSQSQTPPSTSSSEDKGHSRRSQVTLPIQSQQAAQRVVPTDTAGQATQVASSNNHGQYSAEVTPFRVAQPVVNQFHFFQVGSDGKVHTPRKGPMTHTTSLPCKHLARFDHAEELSPGLLDSLKLVTCPTCQTSSATFLFDCENVEDLFDNEGVFRTT